MRWVYRQERCEDMYRQTNSMDIKTHAQVDGWTGRQVDR
jgi:hypothetical protein